MTIEILEYLDDSGHSPFGTETDGRITKIVILLQGGTKKSQSNDIDMAKRHWKNYKARKRKGKE